LVESLSLSPFSTVLEVLTERLHDPNLNRIKALIDSVIVENGLVLNTNLSREAFFASFQSEESWSPSHATFAFVDNCVMRLTQKPVHYLDLVHDMQNKMNATGVVSLLFAVMAEQWPFVVKAGNGDDQEHIAMWIARYLGYSKHAVEDEALLSSIRDQMADATSNKRSRSAFKKAFKHIHPEKLNTMNLHEAEKAKPFTEAKSNQRPVPPSLEDTFGVVPKAHRSSKGLTRLSGSDEVEEAVLQGYVGDLAMCFCSERGELHTSAYFNTKNFMAHRLEQSAYSEAKPIYLLLGEVAETAKSAGFIQMPYIFGELAARSALVLADPLHKMYGKINKYLNKGPKWDWRKIPSYWIDRVLLREPEHDDGYHVEVDWLLDLLVSGLRMEDVCNLSFVYKVC
jgi:nucleolar pre-ribosomal-associated protein 1